MTLAQELQRIIESGNEEEARTFIAEHFMEFPDESRGEIAVGLLADAIDASIADTKSLGDIKDDAAGMIAFLDEESQN